MAIVSRADLKVELWESNAQAAGNAAVAELKELCELTSQLKVIELGRSEDRAIAPVASDGGECRIVAEPFGFDIIRVADSEGTVYAEHVIALTDEPFTASQKIFNESELLQNFCDRIKVPWDQLSFLIPGHETNDESNITTADMLPVIRDILEWAALVDLAAKARPFRVLLLKDGPLRTKSLTPNAVPKLRDYLMARYKSDGTLVAGVSKKSLLLDRLYLAIKVQGLLERDSPCCTKIDDTILKAVYKYDTYLTRQSFATTYVCKFAFAKCPYYAVDVADFQDDPDQKKTLEILSTHSQTTFQRIGYPSQLLRAHEYAHISDLDNSVVGKILKKSLIEAAGSEIAETLMAEVFLKKGFKVGGIR